MNFNYSETKALVKEQWTEFDAQYPEDLIGQIADSLLPVYNHEVIADWQEMPREFEDSWKDLGLDISEDDGIFRLMMIDLYSYYESLVRMAYNEIKEELEEREVA